MILTNRWNYSPSTFIHEALTVRRTEHSSGSPFQALSLSCGVALIVLLIATVAGAETLDGKPYHRLLPIPPRAQETPQSCWLAVSEMVLRYFRVPVDTFSPVASGLSPLPAGLPKIAPLNFGPLVVPATAQCHIYLITLNPADGKCSPAGEKLENVKAVMSLYPVALRQSGSFLYEDQQIIASSLLPRSLTANEIATQIDSGSPIAAIVNISGTPHIVLISGYDRIGSTFFVTVNDPFPYKGVLDNTFLLHSSLSSVPMQYRVSLEFMQDTSEKGADWSASLMGFRAGALPAPLLPPLSSDPDAKPTRVVIPVETNPLKVLLLKQYKLDLIKLVRGVIDKNFDKLPKASASEHCTSNSTGNETTCVGTASILGQDCDSRETAMTDTRTTTLTCILDTGTSAWVTYEKTQAKIAVLLPIGYQLEKVSDGSTESDVSGVDVRLKYDTSLQQTAFTASYTK